MAAPVQSSNTSGQYGELAEEYDVRPNYPKYAIDNMFLFIGDLPPNARVVDLASGTGKLYQACQGHLQGRQVTAIEKDPAMAEKFKKNIPNIPINVGSAEETGLESKSVDLILVGTGYHWFPPEATKKELPRILVPKGKLAMIWYQPDPSVAWIDDVRKILDSQPRNHDTGEWKVPFEKSFFSNLETKRDSQFHYLEKEVDEVIKIFSTFSGYKAMSEQQKLEFPQKIRDILAKYPETQNRSKIKMKYRSEVYVCTNLPQSVDVMQTEHQKVTAKARCNLLKTAFSCGVAAVASLFFPIFGVASVVNVMGASLLYAEAEREKREVESNLEQVKKAVAACSGA